MRTAGAVAGAGGDAVVAFFQIHETAEILDQVAGAPEFGLRGAEQLEGFEKAAGADVSAGAGGGEGEEPEVTDDLLHGGDGRKSREPAVVALEAGEGVLEEGGVFGGPGRRAAACGRRRRRRRA